ncbi:hypothetical protein LTR85_001036 [Meristemomyces frigidus]|nr:hypothetical protein LTR85_001036 [Meristemomyces frigidus]
MPIKTQLADATIRIDSLERSNDAKGVSSVKDRFSVIINRIGAYAQVIYGTGTRPVAQWKHLYVYLVHQDDADQDPGMDIMKTPFHGDKSLSKETWAFLLPLWVDLRLTPISFEGALCLDTYEMLADALQHLHGGALRTAARERQVQDTRAVGQNPAGLETDLPSLAPKTPEQERIEALEERLAEVEEELANTNKALSEEKRKNALSIPSPPESKPEKEQQLPSNCEALKNAEDGQVSNETEGAGDGLEA